MKKKEVKKKLNKGDEVAITPDRIDWKIPDDLIRRYVTNFLVQKGNNEFFISFFEITPPVMFTLEQVSEYYQSNPKIPARCVGGIVLSQQGLDSLLGLLKRHASDPSQSQVPAPHEIDIAP